MFVVEAYSQPANDNCNGAQLITPNGSCNNGTTVNATDGWTGTVGCQSGNNHPEVWYTFVATGTSLSVNITAGTITGNLEFVLVQATSPCNGLTIMGSLCGASPLTGTVNGLTVGTTYYFTISSSTSSQGTFSVCVNNTSPPTIPGQDCSSSAVLCNSNSFSQGTFTGIGTAENVDLNSCFGGNERQSKWYKFTAGCSGTFEFMIDPNINLEDFDWAIWNTTTSCYSSGTTMGVPLDCNWSGCPGNTGISTNPCAYLNYDCVGNPNDCNSSQINTTAINLVAGQTYTLLVDNFTSSGGGFSMSFGGTAVIGPDARFTYSAGACGTYTFNKTCQTSNSTFLWQFGDGATSFDQNPSHTYTTFGNFMITLQVTDALGCIETFSQTINIVATPPPGVTTPVTYCVGAAALPLSATGTGLLWYTSASGGSGSATAPTPSTAAPGTTSYWVSQTITDCESPRVQIDVIVIPAPTVSVNSTSICVGQSSTLTATPSVGGGTYSWSPGGATSQSITVTPTTTTTYTVTYTLAGCPNTGSGTVTVNPVPTVSVNNASICVGQSSTLTATPSFGGGTYSWSPGGATSQSITVSPTTTTTYTVTYTLAGCPNTGSGTVTVNPVPTVSVNNASICVGQSSTLTATPSVGGGTYSWSPGGATSQSITVSPTTTTTYTVTYTLAGCPNTGSGTVTVNPVPTVSVNNASICVGQSSTLTATPSVGGGTYSWSPGGATSQSITVSPTTTTTYTVTYTLAGCPNTGSGTVTVNPVPTVSVNNASICVGQSSTLTATPSVGGGTYSWSPGGATSQSITVSPTTTTTYTVTYTLAGCPNTGSGTVTVGNVTASTTNTTICNNQLPYIWNSQSYNSAGTYSVTLTSASGCDSVATLVLTVNPAVTSTTNTTICNNQLPYSWNSQTYNSAGTYSVTLTSASGCDSVATLVLTVNPTLTSTTNTTICNNQLPYLWNSQSYNSAGTFTVTLTSASGCDSVATLVLTVNPAVTSTTNTTICNNQLPYLWNSQSYNSTGTYSVTLTSASGCDSVATLVLTVNPAVTSTTNTTICNNQLPYSWNSQTYNSAGTFTVTLTSASGCDSVATLVLMVNPALTSTTNTTICNNQLPYSWNSQSYNSAGTYSVTLTSASGCDSVATLVLTVNPAVTSATNTTICNNQLPYSWNSQTYNSAGTYLVTLTSASGCDSVATLVLTVNPTLTSTTNTTICNNQLPYTWNSQTYNSAGTYSVILTSASGCDSVATLVLTVNPALTSTTNTTICNNQLPYLWNSQSYNSAGTYSVTLTSASGCDSVATLVLTVNPTLTSTTNTTICNNQLPYLWNSQTYNSAGTYSVTLTSASGCDSIATLVLTVNPTLTSTTNTTICNNQLPYSWNSQSYNSAGTFTVTLTSASGCDSVATLVLTVNPAVTSTTNTTICNNQLPYSWNSQTYNSAGTYSVTLTSASGCDSVATLVLTVNPTLTSTTNTTICNNQLPYSWNSQSYNSAGTYSVTLTSASGCDSVATLVLTVNPAVTSTTNTTICNNQLPYSWNSQTYNSAGTYSVTLTSASGCDSVATLVLTVNPTATSTSSIVVCNDHLPLVWNNQSYNAAGTYSVTLTSANGCDSIATLNLIVYFTTSSTTNVSICSNQLPYLWNNQSYNAAGTYSVVFVSNSRCDSTAILNLTVNLVLTSTTSVNVCNDQLPYTWNNQTYNSAGTYSVTLPSSSGCDSIATLILGVNPVATSASAVLICNDQLPYTWNGQIYNAAGTYSVTLISSSGCDSIASLTLAVENPPPGIRYNTVNAYTNTPIQLQGRPLGVGYNYQWNPSMGLNFDNVRDPVFNFNQSTEYVITIRSIAGCETWDTVFVRVTSPADSLAEVYVPRAWTPNNDGHNDRLFAFTVNVIQLNYFRIFNRWGQLVFESKTLGQGWDGKYRGQPMIPDVYTWTFEGISVKGDIIRKSGESLLLR
jgi:gliding motility-associated-like protein